MVRTRTLAALFATLALVATALFTAASPAAADDEFFCPFATESAIQAAIDTSVAGDTITIWGTCEVELVVPTGKDIRIIGAGPLGATLTADGSGTVITVEAGAKALLDNLTLTDGFHLGGSLGAGALLVDGEVRASDLRIVGNDSLADNRDAGGVVVRGDGVLLMTDSTVADNGSGTSAYGGLYADDSATVDLIRVTFRDNEGTQAGGFRIDGNATSTLRDVAVIGNRSSVNGGIRIGASAAVTATGLTVSNNVVTTSVSSEVAAGLKVSGGSAMSVTGLTVTGNRVEVLGSPSGVTASAGVMAAGGGSLTVEDATIVFNRVTGSGPSIIDAGGAAANGGATLTAASTLIALNTANSAGGVQASGSGTFDGGGARVLLNRATSGTGGVRVIASATADSQLSAFNLFGNCSGFTDPGCL